MRASSVLVLVAMCGWPTLARAQPEATPADVLFREGKALMDAGRVEEGCAMLASSHKVEAAGGTLVNLASCYERLGRYASAERALREALLLAQQAGRSDAEAFVNERLEAISKNVSTLHIVLGERRAAEDSSLEVDGARVSFEGTEIRLAVDPGEHSILVETRGAPLWRDRRRVEGPGSVTEVLVGPPPEPMTPADPPVVATPEAAPTSVDPLVPLGITGLALGGGLLIGGIVAGAIAATTWADASERCPEVDCDDPVGIAGAENAQVFGDTATGLLVAGGVVTATGGLMLVISLFTDDPVVEASATGVLVRF